MFLHPCNVFSCSKLGDYSFYCAVCKQRFQTEKNFKRHNNSRKHIKQTQFFDANPYRTEQANERRTDFDLLPNDVLDYMVSDLAGADQVIQKDDFFSEIQLLHKNELDSMPSPPKLKSPSSTSLHSRVDVSPIVYRPYKPSIRKIPAIYPCLTCFQHLDSQKNFDEHMLQAHFNGCFGEAKEFECSNSQLC